MNKNSRQKIAALKNTAKTLEYEALIMPETDIKTKVINGETRIAAGFIADHFDLDAEYIRVAAKIWQQSHTHADLRACVQSYANDFWLDLTAFDALVGDQPQIFDEIGIEEIRYALGAYSYVPDVAVAA